jgi:hypothetical protein
MSPDLDRAQLAHAVGAFAAKAMKEAALLAKMAAWLADDSYPIASVTAHLCRLTGRKGVMLREQVAPFAAAAKALSSGSAARRRVAKAIIERNGVVYLPAREQASKRAQEAALLAMASAMNPEQ